MTGADAVGTRSPSEAREPSPVKRALAEIRELRARLADAEAERSGPVAVVGMGCRFPGGASGPDAYWRLLREGKDAVSAVPSDRWPIEAWFDPDPATPGKVATRWGGFVEGVADFDPGVFGISPREAEMMDPQQRLLLEVAWEALEHAGHAPDSLAGSRSGVFVGISSMDHAHLVMAGSPESHDAFMAQGIAHSAASGRLAYVLGLQGPALSVDTACSSSLVAVHLAIQSLRRGESELALAAGVNVILQPHLTVGMSRAQMMAPDGRCKAFDASANGFVRSEGCGVVVLKRLDDALADGDRIWAVIRGSAANQDGRSSGMAAPNGPSQSAVIRAALADAGVDPADVGYVEAHGTGTALGDPIEAQALGEVLGTGRGGGARLRIGSVKTNLGHLEAAAGVAGLVKAVLVVHHGEIPPHLHFSRPSPHVAWEALGLEVVAEGGPFPGSGTRRLAGVSSFGFTGTNVHVVLESAPVRQEAAPDVERSHGLLKISGRTGAALDRLAGLYAAHLATAPERFEDQCRTAAVGRADLNHRLAVVANDRAGAAEALRDRGNEPVGVFRGEAREGEPPEVAFLFTGHGAQYVNMGRGLFESEPVFRAAVEECDRLLADHLELPLLPVLYPDVGHAVDEVDSPLMTGMTLAQPALFAVEYGLSALWRSWGVEPTMVLGHSVGEYAAACTAGILEVDDALRLVVARGRLLDSLPGRGAMAAIFAGVEDVESIVHPYRDDVVIAALNGPTEVVVSGVRDGVDAVVREAERRGLDSRRLRVARAAHSPLLEPILDEFASVLEQVRFRPPAIDLVSCTTGRIVGPDEVAEPAYWRRHLRDPVRFAPAVETLRREGATAFLEIGPNPVLTGMVGRILPEGSGALMLPSLREGEDDRRELLESVARFWVRGGGIEWRAFHAGADDDPGKPPRVTVSLPTYPWQHRTFPPARGAASGGADAATTGSGVTGPASSVDRDRAWDAALAAGRRQEGQAPLELEAPRIPEVWAALEALTTAIMADTLQRMGVFERAGEPRSHDALVREMGVLPEYQALVGRWLRRLSDAGLLERKGGAFVSVAPFDGRELERAWAVADELPDDASFLVEYLRRCHRLLPGVLTGRESPLETLFPGGDTGTADLLYRDWALVRYFNHLVGAVVAGALDGRPGGQGLRVLELGAGTGGTTAALLPLVADHVSRYDFTDVSDLFLERAERTFEGREFLRFGLLDINRDPAEQGFGSGTYDIVVAANVLHAAADLPRSLGYARSLLAPGGLLVALETTEYLAWFDVSTALLEGWESHDDPVRGDHPLLRASEWEEQLRGVGFERIAAFPEDGSPAAAFGLHVLLARLPGAGVPGASSYSGGAALRAPSVRDDEIDAREEGAPAFAEKVRSALPADRERLLTEYVRGRIRRLLRLDPSEPVDRRRRLMELGLDSLMAVELRSQLGRGLGLARPLPATLVFDYPTIEAIVGLLERVVVGLESPGEKPVERGAKASSSGGPAGAGEGEDLGTDELSEEEAEAKLLERLEAMEGSDP